MEKKALSAAVDVFGYLDYRAYLKDWYQAYKGAHPRFSYRVLADKVGFRSPSFFTLILQSKSNISVEMGQNFAEAIGLNRRETEYFLLLVRYNQEELPSQRRKFFQRLAQYKNSAATLLRQDQDAFMSSWKHAAIRELLGIEPFQNGEAAWGRRLTPPCSGQEVRESLDLLLRLGLAHRTVSGIVRTAPCVETGTSYSEEATLGYMRQVHALGGEALDRFPRIERHHAWATVSISKETLDLMREELRALVAKFLALAEKDATPDRVMQLNLEFFPLAYRKANP